MLHVQKIRYNRPYIKVWVKLVIWKLFLSFNFINNYYWLTSTEITHLIQSNVSSEYNLSNSQLQIHLNKHSEITTRIYEIKLFLNMLLVINIFQKPYLDGNSACLAFCRILTLTKYLIQAWNNSLLSKTYYFIRITLLAWQFWNVRCSEHKFKILQRKCITWIMKSLFKTSVKLWSLL